MASFAIEVYEPGLTEPFVQELTDRVKRTVAELAAQGADIRYVRCTLSPGDEILFVRLEAASVAAIDEVVRHLGLADTRVSEMVDL